MVQDSAAAAAPARLVAGQALVAACATTFALNSTVARLSYDGGMDALTLNLARAAVSCLVLALLLRWQGAPLRLERPIRRVALACGLLTGSYSFALFAAISHIPVALAVVIFYLFPLFTGVIGWLSGREPFTWRGAAALLLAFAGLMLALGLSERPLDPVGVALAFYSAVGITVVLTVIGRLIRGRDSRPVTLHMQASAALGFVVACAFVGGPAVPTAPVGWLGLLAVPLLYTFSFTGFYAGVSKIGPTRAATIMNLEPVMSVLFGWLLLGQHLGPSQIAGVALVIGALLLVRRS